MSHELTCCLSHGVICCPSMNVVFENAPKNLKYTSSNIQNGLVHACAIETIDAITEDTKRCHFFLLVDGPRDVSTKEKIVVLLYYVNKRGEVIKRFLGVQHTASITTSLLEEAIEKLFAITNLSMSKLGGQCYGKANGANNTRAVSKGNVDVATFFITASSLAVVEVLEWIKGDGIQDILGEANRKYQDIVNAMALVEVCKQCRQSLKDDDSGDLFHNVQKFCEENDIIVPKMEDLHSYIENQSVKLQDSQTSIAIIHSEFSSLKEISDLAKELVKI
ncbi:unnamed protein product [Malus baccata var. baccata]